MTDPLNLVPSHTTCESSASSPSTDCTICSTVTSGMKMHVIQGQEGLPTGDGLPRRLTRFSFELSYSFGSRQQRFEETPIMSVRASESAAFLNRPTSTYSMEKFSAFRVCILLICIRLEADILLGSGNRYPGLFSCVKL